MPTYEYLCNACGHDFERVQRITDPKVKTCPKCKKRQVERLISQTSFVLKGGGWYSDLYSSGGKKDAKGTEADAKSESSPDAKSDSKSDAKSDSKPGKGKSDPAAKPDGKSKKSKGPKAAA